MRARISLGKPAYEFSKGLAELVVELDACEKMDASDESDASDAVEHRESEECHDRSWDCRLWTGSLGCCASTDVGYSTFGESKVGIGRFAEVDPVDVEGTGVVWRRVGGDFGDGGGDDGKRSFRSGSTFSGHSFMLCYYLG